MVSLKIYGVDQTIIKGSVIAAALLCSHSLCTAAIKALVAMIALGVIRAILHLCSPSWRCYTCRPIMLLCMLSPKSRRQVCAADTQRLLGCAEDCNDVSQATVGTPKGAGIGNDAEVI